LQGEFSKAGINTGRFLINTTVGILGFIDVASLDWF
jgi:phospholipid-binding lipoprotein MlaA